MAGVGAYDGDEDGVRQVVRDEVRRLMVDPALTFHDGISPGELMSGQAAISRQVGSMLNIVVGPIKKNWNGEQLHDDSGEPLRDETQGLKAIIDANNNGGRVNLRTGLTGRDRAAVYVAAVGGMFTLAGAIVTTIW